MNTIKAALTLSGRAEAERGRGMASPVLNAGMSYGIPTHQ
jgi:hypothetical protein